MRERLTVGASILILEDPLDYSKVRFDAVDILYISPFRVLEDKKFGFEGDPERILPIFRNVVQMARGLNPDISIVAMQMWSVKRTIDQLKTDADIEAYANSAAQFIVDQCIDGYDNDYEAGNVCEQAGKVLSAIRQKLNKVRSTPSYHVSVAPSDSDHLDNAFVRSSLTHIIMQNYSGGIDQKIDKYKQMFQDTDVKIIFGVNSEVAQENWHKPPQPVEVGNSKNVFDSLYEIVITNELDGIYNWRLDSGDWVFQNAFQVYLYNRFHGKNLSCPFTLEQIITTWPKVVGEPIDPFK